MAPDFVKQRGRAGDAEQDQSYRLAAVVAKALRVIISPTWWLAAVKRPQDDARRAAAIVRFNQAYLEAAAISLALALALTGNGVERLASAPSAARTV